MKLKRSLKTVICFVLLFIAMQSPISAAEQEERSLNALAALVFHLNELHDLDPSLDTIQFSDEEIVRLWEVAAHQFDATSFFETAQGEYYHALQCADAAVAQKLFTLCSANLTNLWEEAIERDSPKGARENLFQLTLRSQGTVDANFHHNPHLPSKARKKMERFLLPLNHPMRAFLDALCLNQRITANRGTFENAGFQIVATGPRSFINVARHPEMPGYLVKVHFDNVLRKKRGKESWEWLVHRCEGAAKVRKVIQHHQLKLFTVARKWIYCLPAEPAPPKDMRFIRHLAMLLVDDMDLASEEENYDAWKHAITKAHLEELYLIISRAKGSSYRPDNIAYTNKGDFAFIDTEYPANGPDFRSIRHYLNTEMRAEWDKIVKRGGP